MLSSAFERGYLEALADGKKPRWTIWLKARELAEAAVYAPGGLTDEQAGYAAGLAACLPAMGSDLPEGMADILRLVEEGTAERLPIHELGVSKWRAHCGCICQPCPVALLAPRKVFR